MYALVALGYNITYATSRTVNFSQGQSVMVGAVVAYALHVGAGWPFWAALPVTLVALALLGVVVERVAVRPFLRARSIAWLLATIALGIIAENVAMLTFGKDARAFPSSLAVKPVTIFGAGVFPPARHRRRGHPLRRVRGDRRRVSRHRRARDPRLRPRRARASRAPLGSLRSAGGAACLARARASAPSSSPSPRPSRS